MATSDQPPRPESGVEAELTSPGGETGPTGRPPPPNVEADRDRRALAAAHLERRELRRGQKPGDVHMRIVRPHARDFRRAAQGHIVATEHVLEPHGPLARLWTRVRRIVIGPPLSTAQSAHERIPRSKALAVFASDALSSSAYASEEILLALAVAGAGVVGQFTLPVTAAIITLLAIVATAYRQTIHAYPSGGGAYIVTRDNLGDLPALLAASALLIGYVLTVAVSISAGVAAITSAWPLLHPYQVELAVLCVVFMTLVNLRGVRESANIFTVPTYVFLAVMFVMFAVGVFKALILGDVPQAEPVFGGSGAGIEGLALLFLLARAFSSGCAALTGTEAISDGVPAFKEPQAKSAADTLLAMAILAGGLFAGVSVLAHLYGVVPAEGHETVVSQVARLTFGDGPLYYLVQAATMAILILAANTAFADFPRLSYFLARDGFLPRQFSFRGERLAFSTGIVVLGLVSSVLVVAFGASTHALIPLYAAGVFISFTCSQTSMFRRWRTRREPGWQRGSVINGVGAVTCGVVTLITAGTKFTQGAWMILVLIPAVVSLLYAIHQHYERVQEELTLDPTRVGLALPATKPLVIVPLPGLHLGLLPALAFAREISDSVTAVHVTDDPASADELKQRWEAWGQHVPLVIIESPYRSLLQPLLAYIHARREDDPERVVTLVLAEFVPKHWWEWILHNQTALRLKLALFFEPNVVVADVPYHLKR